MSQRKKKDQRRFDFCIRCLRDATNANPLIEHHLKGRRTDPADVVFICNKCKPFVENQNGPVIAESDILRKKKSLLINSPSLVWIIKNRKNIISSFQQKNRNGPSLMLGSGYSGSFGAIGNSGRKYFFIDPQYIDSSAEIPSDIDPQKDGVGGPAGGTNWMRFKGREGNVLNSFIELHRKHVPPEGNISELMQ